MDYYGYTDYDTSAAFGILGGIAIIGLILLLISFACSIIYIIGLWKTFKKAGKGGWESLIPFYNQWVLVEISGLNWWWFLFSFAPLVLAVIGLAWVGTLASIFASFNCFYNLAKKFNRGTGFAICLTLFAPICIPILGLSKDNIYNPNALVSKNGVIGEPDTPNNNNYQQNTQPNYNNVNQNTTSNVSNMDSNTSVYSQQSTQNFSFCGNCGTKLEQNTKFCPNCGKQNI